MLDESEITVCEELMAASVMEGEGADEEGWQGMDMAGVDAMVDFLESLVRDTHTHTRTHTQASIAASGDPY